MHAEVKTAAEFDAATAAGDVLVDFWAPWCSPCQLMGAAIASELEPQRSEIKVVKVNVDEAPELAARFGIASIPALFCFRGGVKTAEFVGFTPVKDILAAFA